VSLHFAGPRAPSSILSRTIEVSRRHLPPALRKAIAEQPEPLKAMPGRNSGPRYWRSPDCSPAPSPKRRTVTFR
jgi:hypothetical protein